MREQHYRRFTHVAACVSASFHFLTSHIPLYEHTTFHLTIHQFIDIWVVSSFWAIMNNAAMNLPVQIFVWTCFPFQVDYT